MAKSWNRMSLDEKLDWLYLRVEELRQSGSGMTSSDMEQKLHILDQDMDKAFVALNALQVSLTWLRQAINLQAESLKDLTVEIQRPEPMPTELGAVDRNPVVHLVGLATTTIGAVIAEIGFSLLPITLVERLLAEPAQNAPDKCILSVPDLDGPVSAVSAGRHGPGPGFSARPWRGHECDPFCSKIIAEGVPLSFKPLAAYPNSLISNHISLSPIAAMILSADLVRIGTKRPSQPECAPRILRAHEATSSTGSVSQCPKILPMLSLTSSPILIMVHSLGSSFSYNARQS